MELLVLNTNFEALGIIDNYESLIWTDRYDAYGDFELYVSVTPNLLNLLKEDYYLWLKESEHIMIIESISITSDAENGNDLVITGRSLESILERRIVWGQKVLTGNLQSAIQTLLTEAIISPSITDRKIDNFIFESSTDTRIINLLVDVQVTGDDLHSVIQTLCKINYIGFKIRLNDLNQFVFSLYMGKDRSYNQTINSYVIFSPNFENIANSNYYRSKTDFKNVTLVGGEDEGIYRKTVTVGSGSGLNRRELFTDARDISSDVEGGTLTESEYASKLTARGYEKLAEHLVKNAFDGEVEATQLFKYGEDFFIGDIVQLSDDYGNEGIVSITELILSQNKEGLSLCPTFKTV